MKALKILGWIIGGLLVVILAAVVILSLMFDPNDYKDTVAELVREQTGRELVIEDDLELSVFPWLGVETGAVSLSNAEGFGDQPFARLERMQVRVRLWPLLSRQVEMGEIILSGLRLNLARDSEGRTNWDDLLTARESLPDEPGPEPEEGAFAIDSLTAQGLELQDAAVFWHENVDEVSFIVRNVNLQTGTLTMEEPLEVSLGFRLVSTDPQLSADFELEGTAEIGLESQQYGVQDLHLRFDIQDSGGESWASGTLTSGLSADLGKSVFRLDEARLTAELADAPMVGATNVQASWTGAVADLQSQTLELTAAQIVALGVTSNMELRGTRILDAPRLAGSVNVANAPLQKLIEQIDPALLDEMDPSALGTLDLTTEFSLDVVSGAVEVKGMRASALGLELEAGLGVADSTRASGQIRIPPSKPDRLRKALGSLLPDSLDAGTLGTLAFQSAVELDLKADTLALSSITAEVMGATASGNVQVAKLTDKPRLEGTLSIPKIPGDRIVSLIGDSLPDGVGPKELGKISLQTEFLYTPDRDRAILKNVQAEALGLKFAGRMEATQLSSAPQVTGKVKFHKFSPRALLKRLGNRNPNTTDKKVLTSATVQTGFALSSSAARFDEIAVTLDRSRVTGSFALEDFDAPSYKFDLDVDKFNADRYLPRDDEAPAAAEEVEPTTDVEIPVEAFRDLRIDGRIGFGVLTVGGIVGREVKIKALAADGLVQLNPASATLYRGAFEGSVAADARQNVAGISFTGNLTGLNLRGITTALSESGEAMLRGQGNFNVSLQGRGKTIGETMQSLAGNIGFDIRKGGVLGFNLGHIICSAYNVATRRPRPSSEGIADETPFDEMRGTAVVAQGVGTTNDLAVRSSYMQVTGRGKVDLPKQRLDYDVEATLTDKIALEGCEALDKHVGASIPVEIKGPITDPKIRPDLEELAKQQVRDAIEDKVEDKLRDLLKRD